MEALARLDAWVNTKDSFTWVSHAVIAVALALVFSPAIAVGYYAIREAEQVLYRLIRRQPLHPLDHLMDVVAPAAAVGLLVLA